MFGENHQESHLGLEFLTEKFFPPNSTSSMVVEIVRCYISSSFKKIYRSVVDLQYYISFRCTTVIQYFHTLHTIQNHYKILTISLCCTLHPGD